MNMVAVWFLFDVFYNVKCGSGIELSLSISCCENLMVNVQF